MFTYILIIMLQHTDGKPVINFKKTGTYIGEIGNEINIDARGLQYLHDAGYLKFSKVLAMSSNQQLIVTALRRFQEYAGIKITGKFDDATKEYMRKPRCGMPDVVNVRRRRRRFNNEGSSWKHRNITWALENSNNDGLTDNKVRQLFRNAFNKWQTKTFLNFIELVGEPEDSADIRIRFAEGMHKYCPNVFDGKGGTIAHSFYPRDNKGLSGDVHLDDHETFTASGYTVEAQYKLLYIATHELGHSLGISHSEKKGAVMYSIYQDLGGNDFKLTYDDIQSIQHVYGEKKIPTPSVKTTSTTATKPPLCTKVMRAVYLGDNKLHVINTNQMYTLYEFKEGIEKGPIQIENIFPSLSSVDTVFRRHNDEYLVFFHGDRFTIYDNNNNLIDKSRRINDGFQNINEKLTHIDAALIWPANKKLYIFKGEDYWRMRQLSNLDYIAEYGYPLKIAAKWNGLPDTIDSAFQWINNKIYFTRGEYYYRWDENRNAISSGYPIKLERSFLKCIL